MSEEREAQPFKAREQIGCKRNSCTPIDAQRFANPRDQKQQRNARIDHDVLEAVNAIIAATIWNKQRLCVMNTNEARRIAAR